MKSTGLIGHWPLNEFSSNLTTVTDKSRSGNHGTLSSTTIITTDGKSFEFNGTTGSISTNSDNIGIGNFTISVWTKPRSMGEYSVGHIFFNNKFLLYNNNNAIKVSSDAGTLASSASVIALNSWQHICVTRAVTGLVNIYINSVLSGAADQNSGTPIAGTTNIYIGNSANGSRSYDGFISDVKTYSYILNERQIRREYDSTKNNYI